MPGSLPPQPHGLGSSFLGWPQPRAPELQEGDGHAPEAEAGCPSSARRFAAVVIRCVPLDQDRATAELDSGRTLGGNESLRHSRGCEKKPPRILSGG